MANRDRFKPNSAILKLAFYLILALLTSAPSCGRPIRNSPSGTIISKPINTRARAGTNTDNITKREYGRIRIIEELNNNSIDTLNDIEISLRKNRFFQKTNNCIEIQNQDIVLISSDYIRIINADKIRIINADKIGLQEEDLEALCKGDVLLVFPDSITSEDIKNDLQQVSDKAAQEAVKQAWSEDVSRESLKALANEPTRKAIFQELHKWTSLGVIVLISKAELDAIVNQSVDKALQESTTESRKINSFVVT